MRRRVLNTTRPVAWRGALLLPLALAFASAAPARAADPGDSLLNGAASPRFTEAAYCVWQASQFGASNHESAAWVVVTEAGVGLIAWPSAAGAHRSVWRGDVPRGAAGVLHTHPRADGPRPSGHDARLARSLALPVSVVSREGIFTARPDGRTVKDVEASWFAAYSGSSVPACTRPQTALTTAARDSAGITTSAAFAPVAGPGSWRTE